MSQFCSHCGERSERGDLFCVACGRRLRTANADQTAPPRHTTENRAFVRGIDLLKARKPAEAAEVLERLCEVEPDWAVPRAYLGIAYLRASRVADARVALEAAVAMAPGSFICRSKYAEFLAQMGFYDQAVNELDLALDLPAPDAESRHAALELRQFARERAKGLFYRRLDFPGFQRRPPFLTRREPAKTSAAVRSA